MRVRIEVDGGAELLSPEAEVELGTLAGHHEEEVDWLVHHGPEGGTVRVTAWHPKAGTATRSLELSSMAGAHHHEGGRR